MDKIQISSEVLTAHGVQRLEALVKSCPDNFSCSDTDVGNNETQALSTEKCLRQVQENR